MPNNQKYHFILLAFLPCIIWGIMLGGFEGIKDKFIYPQTPYNYSIFYIVYLLTTLIFLPVFFSTHKKYLPTLYYTHNKIYASYSILSVACIIIGILFIQTKFWSYLLNGCLISPLLEELIAHSILYEAWNKGFKFFALIAIITSVSFSLMHFGYEPSALLDKVDILHKFNGHFLFSLLLSGIFWFVPKLRLLSFIHGLFNLCCTLAEATELGS